MSGETVLEKQSASVKTFSRRTLLKGSALSIAALGIYATEIERHFIEVVQKTFRLRNLPEAFRGFRFVQMSDIHLEHFTEDFFLRHAVDKINDMAPDMVLLTGDFISNNMHGSDQRAIEALPHCGALLQHIKCPLRFGSLGNHDLAVDAPAVVEMLTTHGVTPLVNRHVAIERNGERIWLAGLDDCFFGMPDIQKTIPVADNGKPDAPVILMCHEPDFTETLVQHPQGSLVDLVLSGHSHGGQVRIPFLRPVLLPPMGTRFYEGQYQIGNTQLYVNRGLGTVGLPIRFNCPPELTHITLEPA